MVVNGNELMPKVLAMFRRGFDTAAIGSTLEIKEATIERVLHAALAGNRMSSYLLHEPKMERDRDEEEDSEEERDNH
jgi:hypothetical protein